MADSAALLDAFAAKHPERIRWTATEAFDYGFSEGRGCVIIRPSGRTFGCGVRWQAGFEPSDVKGIIARKLRRKLKRWLRHG